jgi:photosystem II stability/assembly factor-like uncharacterized protein
VGLPAATIGALLLALISASGSFAQEGDQDQVLWAIQAPLAARSLLLDVAAAGDRLVAVGDRGHILLSDDNGRSWRQVEVPTRALLTGVHFQGAELGWAVGHDAMILRSRDGGSSWEIVFEAPEEEAPLFGVWFSDPDNGYAFGAYGMYLVTEDGGSTWDWLTVSDSDFHLHHISRSDTGRLYMAAEAGIIYASDDGGRSWQELPSPYDGSFFGTITLGGDSVLLFGLRGHLFRSDDGGQNWQELETDTVAMLNDAVAVDGGRLIVLGLGGAVLVSDDGGSSFSLVPRPDRLGVSAVIQAADGGLILVGEGGVRRLGVDEIAQGAAGETGGGAP